MALGGRILISVAGTLVLALGLALTHPNRPLAASEIRWRSGAVETAGMTRAEIEQAIRSAAPGGAAAGGGKLGAGGGRQHVLV